MLRFKPNPNLMAHIEADLEDSILVAAEAAADLLRERLSPQNHQRTGIHYDKYPRVSSAFGEYPQEQFGSLRNSVASVRLPGGGYGVGFFGEDPEKLEYLEYTGKGRRMPLFMHFVGEDSTETLDDMTKAIVGSR